MKYIIKEIIDGKEETIYTKCYEELEREYFELYLEEEGIDEEEFEEEDGDMDELWDEFFESEHYKEFLEIIGGENPGLVGVIHDVHQALSLPHLEEGVFLHIVVSPVSLGYQPGHVMDGEVFVSLDDNRLKVL